MKTTADGRRERRNLLEALHVTFPTQSLPTADQNDALVGAYLAWCVHNRPSAIVLVGVAPVVAEGGIREGFILHAGADSGVDLPLTNAVSTSCADIADCEAGVLNDRNDDRACLLKLTDYGVVHGTEPENSWLDPGQNYTVKTVTSPVPLLSRLIHAANFPGGRGWRAQPTVRNLLAELRYPVPQTLSGQNAVTLRVVVV